MNVLSVFASIAVAIATFTLAYAAFRNIRETKKILQEDKRNHIIEKSPILQVKLRTVDGQLTSPTDNKLRIDCRNVGYGPAFNVHIKCYQGEQTLAFAPQKGSFPLTLSSGGEITLECHWPFEFANPEDNVKPLMIESSGESIYRTEVKQTFRLPISTHGTDTQEVLEKIDFGVK